MNPFDLRGPEFLLFYLALSSIVIGLLALARRRSESFDVPKMDLGDPHLIAYLRGGKNEVLRVAVISLVDRGLLVASGAEVERDKKAAPASARKPLDQAVLKKFDHKAEAASVFQDSALESMAEQYREPLEALRLLPDAALTRARARRFLLALFILVGVGGIKIAIALQRGRTNVFILIILMILSFVVARKVAFPRLTSLGSEVLKDVQSLYSGLKMRAAFIRPGGASIEAAMLAAVFGVGALPGDSFAFTRGLFPRAQKSSGTSDGSSSSCGSSCGSSGGSSCGGGGCGGGCGGCGS